MQPFRSRRNVALTLGQGVLGLVLLLVFLLGRDPFLFPAVAVLAYLAWVAADWSRCHLRLSADGRLTARSSLFAYTQDVDLSRLKSGRIGIDDTGWDPFRRYRTILELHDARGGSLRTDISAWQERARLVEAVVRAATARDVAISGGSAFGFPATGQVTAAGARTSAARARLAGDAAPRALEVGSVFRHGVYSAPVVLVLGLFALFIGLDLGGSLYPSDLRDWRDLLAMGGLGAVGAGVSSLAMLFPRVRLAADGELTVRGILDRGRVRLDRLGRVELQYVRDNIHLQVHEYRRLLLVDRDGNRLLLSVHAWEDAGLLVAAIGEWAERAGATADRTTWEYLGRASPPGAKTAPPGNDPRDRPGVVWVGRGRGGRRRRPRSAG